MELNNIKGYIKNPSKSEKRLEESEIKFYFVLGL